MWNSWWETGPAGSPSGTNGGDVHGNVDVVDVDQSLSFAESRSPSESSGSGSGAGVKMQDHRNPGGGRGSSVAVAKNQNGERVNKKNRTKSFGGLCGCLGTRKSKPKAGNDKRSPGAQPVPGTPIALAQQLHDGHDSPSENTSNASNHKAQSLKPFKVDRGRRAETQTPLDQQITHAELSGLPTAARGSVHSHGAQASYLHGAESKSKSKSWETRTDTCQYTFKFQNMVAVEAGRSQKTEKWGRSVSPGKPNEDASTASQIGHNALRIFLRKKPAFCSVSIPSIGTHAENNDDRVVSVCVTPLPPEKLLEVNTKSSKNASENGTETEKAQQSIFFIDLLLPDAGEVARWQTALELALAMFGGGAA